MATQVTTWTEFVTAYKDSNVNEIDIMNDLDCNNDLPTSQIAQRGTKTIHGNYHTIWNLSTGTVVNNALIYTAGYYLTWEKTNFNNISRIEAYPVFSAESSRWAVFNDCTFVGNCPNRIVNNAILNRCTITHTGSNLQTPFSSVQANYCWIRYEHKRNLDNGNAEFSALNSCYVEGKITTDLSSYNSIFDFSYTMDSCVINVETSLPTSISSNPSTTRPVTVFNTDKITNYRGSLSIVKGVSDEQMKDASYLSSVGFNIVV